jgi:hypothetical protein
VTPPPDQVAAAAPAVVLDVPRDAALAAPGDRLTAVHESAMRRIRSIAVRGRGGRRHVVIACMPKSGSTFLTEALVAATGFHRYLLNTRGYDNERTIDRAAIPMFTARDTVSQEHMRATRANIAWLRELEVRPVVLVRNVFDAIVSARDHAVAESVSGPAAHVPPDFATWPAEAQHWFIVRMGVPWMLSLVASWRDAEHELPTMWLTWDEMTSDPVGAVRRVLAHAGIEVAGDLAERVARVRRDERVRFNRGVAGRGMTELTPAQIGAVREIAESFDGYDLGPIGLAPCRAEVPG